MRNTRSELAANVSVNRNDLGAPYGEAELRLVLRKGPKFGNDVMLILSEGQFQCGIMSGCTVSMKFDDDKVRRYAVNESSSPMNPVLFFRDPAGVVTRLKGAKKLMVEVHTFTSGAEQYDFDVAGLDWTLYKGPIVDD